MLSVITFLGLILTALVTLPFSRRRFALVVVGICFLANLLSFATYYISPDLSRVAVTVATREVLIYLSFALFSVVALVITIAAGHLIDRLFFLLLIFFTLMIITSQQSLVSAIFSGRELILPLTIYFLFRCLALDRSSVEAVIRLIIWLAAVGGVLAIVEQVYVNFINPDFWVQIEVGGYLAQKYGTFDEPYSLSWVNYIFGFIGLPPTFRSIGIMIDPLVTGHFLASSFTIILYWIRGIKKYMLLAIVGAGTISTFSKAAVLICFMAIGYQAFSIRNTYVRWTVLAVVFSIVAALGALLLSTGDSAFTHYGAFRFGVETLTQNPLGNGVGSTGFFNYRVTGEGALDAVDSTFAVYVHQMGLPGLVALLTLILAPYLVMIRDLRRARRAGNSSPLALICASLFAVYTLLAFSTAAAFNAVPIFIPMMLLGMYVSLHSKRVRIKIVSKTPTLPGKLKLA